MNKAILALILLTIISAVLGISVLSPSTSSEKSETLRIGTLKHESSLPIYLAEELGYFENLQFGVQLIEVPPGDHMPALLSDRVDILSPTSFTVLFGVMQQNPNLIYAVFPGAEIEGGATVYGIITSSSFAGESIEDLRSSSIMAINPYTRVNLESILFAANIPRAEWPEIRVANRDSALRAVFDGTATAAILDQPALAVALASGDFKLLENNPRAKYIGSPYWSGAGAVKIDRWNDNPDRYSELMIAIDQAVAFAEANPVRAHEILAERLEIDQNIASRMGGYYFPRSKENVSLDGIEATVDALVESELLDAAFALDNFFPQDFYGQ